jgi:hypothetical protein
MNGENILIIDILTLIILAILSVSIFFIYLINPSVTSTPQFQQLQDSIIEAVLILVSFITGKNIKRQS